MIEGVTHGLRAILVSFKTFRCPIFPKPVSWFGLFLLFAYSKPTQTMKILHQKIFLSIVQALRQFAFCVAVVTYVFRFEMMRHFKQFSLITSVTDAVGLVKFVGKFHGPVALYANVFTLAATMYLPKKPIQNLNFRQYISFVCFLFVSLLGRLQTGMELTQFRLRTLLTSLQI